jgi:predicted PurR-regulated permease PerM
LDLALLGIWRISMDYGIAPRVMGHELEIHPLLAISTLMVGRAAGGIVGICLSVPLVGALRVIYRRFASADGRAPLRQLCGLSGNEGRNVLVA